MSSNCKTTNSPKKGILKTTKVCLHDDNITSEEVFNDLSQENMNIHKRKQKRSADDYTKGWASYDKKEDVIVVDGSPEPSVNGASAGPVKPWYFVYFSADTDLNKVRAPNPGKAPVPRRLVPTGINPGKSLSRSITMNRDNSGKGKEPLPPPALRRTFAKVFPNLSQGSCSDKGKEPLRPPALHRTYAKVFPNLSQGSRSDKGLGMDVDMGCDHDELSLAVARSIADADQAALDKEQQEKRDAELAKKLLEDEFKLQQAEKASQIDADAAFVMKMMEDEEEQCELDKAIALSFEGEP